MKYLLDTNVVSELRRRRPQRPVLDWLDSTRQEELYVSVLTIGELRQGVERLRRRDRGAGRAVAAWLTSLLDVYGDRLVPVTSDIADRWGRLNVPDPLPVIDGMLAATALAHDWTLVTRNTADVERTGVRLLNPFTSSGLGD